MKSISSHQAVNRLLDYAAKTGIHFRQVPRGRIWKHLGLPDLRGFNPHLRRINYLKGTVLPRQRTPEQRAAAFLSSEEHQWLLHDLLHILFYDYATLLLGKDHAWLDEDRFLECHLASEAFAVLALDYHILPRASLAGLAADFKPRDWSFFQKIQPALPAFESAEFCRWLVRLYLSGKGVKKPQRINRYVPAAKIRKYEQWLGHEKRYSEKQRYYVDLWRKDLTGAREGAVKVSITKSFVAPIIWELVETLFAKDSESWNLLTERVKRSAAANYFAGLHKYAGQSKVFDFRLTDIHAFTPQKISKILRGERELSPSSLFLVWQILSLGSVSQFSEKERGCISRLAQSAQTLKVDSEAWQVVHKLSSRVVTLKEWKPDRMVLATFFLP